MGAKTTRDILTKISFDVGNVEDGLENIQEYMFKKSEEKRRRLLEYYNLMMVIFLDFGCGNND